MTDRRNHPATRKPASWIFMVPSRIPSSRILAALRNSWESIAAMSSDADSLSDVIRSSRGYAAPPHRTAPG